MDFIKKHKASVIMVGILLILFIFCIIVAYKMFFSYGNNKYGARLENVANLKISNDTKTRLTTELGDLKNVKKVEYDLQGKLINITFKVDASLERDTAKEYANKVLEYFSDEEKKAYDIQVFIVTEEKQEDNKYPIIAYKKSTSDKFYWTNN